MAITPSSGQRNTARAAYGTRPSGISTPVLTIRTYRRFIPAPFVGLWVWWTPISRRDPIRGSLIREVEARREFQDGRGCKSNVEVQNGREIKSSPAQIKIPAGQVASNWAVLLEVV